MGVDAHRGGGADPLPPILTPPRSPPASLDPRAIADPLPALTPPPVLLSSPAPPPLPSPSPRTMNAAGNLPQHHQNALSNHFEEIQIKESLVM